MRVLLCDDNPIERAQYSKYLQEVAISLGFSVEYVEFENAKQLLFDIEDFLYVTDVILLDINMPGISGIEAAQKLREKGFQGEIIFMTISKNHMLGAFDVGAFHYIVKGETKEERTKKILQAVLKKADEKNREYILFTGVGEYRNIAIADIAYFEVNGKIITVYYSNKSFEFVSTLGKLENLLFKRGFIRIHRSYIVGLSHIKSFTYEEITLISGRVIPVGRKYYPKLKEAMAECKFV